MRRPLDSSSKLKKRLRGSVTRLGDFTKLLATNFHLNVAQILGDISGYSESTLLWLQSVCELFAVTVKAIKQRQNTALVLSL